MWSILDNVPCALVKKKMYLAAFVWNVLWYQLSTSVLIWHFKSSISLLIFCLDDLSIGKSEVLKSHIIIGLLLISPQISVSICLMYWSAPMFSAAQSLRHVQLCNPMSRRRLGLPVHHQLPEFTQTDEPPYWTPKTNTLYVNYRVFLGGSAVKNLPASAGDTGDVGSISRSRRSPGGGNSNSFQYSCMGNSMDRKAWQAIVQEVGK